MSVPPRPPMTTDGLVSHTATRTIGVPPRGLYRLVVHDPLELLVVGGGGLAGVSGTEDLPGPAWGQDGARRLVLMADGSRAHEAVVQAAPNRASPLFRYQVWGLSGAAGLIVDHAQGRFVFDPDGGGGEDGTKLSWTYAFKPRAALLRPVLARFVRVRFAPFMEAAMDAIEARATRPTA